MLIFPKNAEKNASTIEKGLAPRQVIVVLNFSLTFFVHTSCELPIIVNFVQVCYFISIHHITLVKLQSL